MRIFILGELTL